MARSNRRAKKWALATLGVGLWIVASSSFAACLAKPWKTIQGGVTLHIFMLAPESQVAEYTSLGFQRVPCPSDRSNLREYVGRLCSGSPLGKVPAINTDVSIGRPRNYACASARAGLAEAGG